MTNRNASKSRITVDDLVAALANPRASTTQFVAFDRYCKQKPTPDAIPVLREALANDYHAVVKCAATALRKLGPAATDAMPDLVEAAYHIHSPTRMPQSYPECLDAMIAIDPTNEELIPLITHFVGLHNWGPISASMKALKTIGTDEAIDLLRRIHQFWYPELNKTQRRVADDLAGA